MATKKAPTAPVKKVQDKPTRPAPRPRTATPTAATTPTSASAWRSRQEEGSPLVVPSGNTCLVRKASGMQAFLQRGNIPNSLRPIMEEAMAEGKPPSMDKLDPANNPEFLDDLMSLLDDVVLMVVLEPKLLPIPLDDDGNKIPMSQRELGEELWVDEVDIEDKMFIFNYLVGGVTSLETFRQEAYPSVGAVPGR